MTESPRITRIRPLRGLPPLRPRDIWQSRNLIWILAKRDVIIFYKQTYLGITWVILQPLLQALVLAFVFSVILRFNFGDVPFFIFFLSGIIPWAFFGRGLGKGAGSLVSFADMLQKVYFPRAVLPVAMTLSGVVDILISLSVLIVILFLYGIFPGWQILAIPGFIAMAALASIGVAFWFSALYAQYRDVGVMLPLISQLWFYLTPIIYPTNIIPERFQIFFWFNPMTPIVDGFRWSLLPNQAAPNLAMIAVSILISSFLIITGYVYLVRVERTLADNF